MKFHFLRIKQHPIAAAVAAALALGGGLVGSNGYAQVTGNLQVTAQINNACIVSATGILDFGLYASGPANLAKDAAGSVTTICTIGAPYTVTLGQGVHADAGSTDALPLRRMVSALDATKFLSYSLFQDAGYNTLWGNTFGAGGTGFAGIGTGLAAPLTVYGRIPAPQNVPAGSYADTVIATVNF